MKKLSIIQKLQRCLHFALLVVLFTIPAVIASASDASASFDSANKLYEEGKFSEAATAYVKMLESGTTSSAVYFNLGNAYFKAGELGHAIAAYRHARELSPRDPDVLANLEFVRSHVQNPTLSPSRWRLWLSALTINEWAVLAAIALWLWLALLALTQIRPAVRQSLRTVIWCSGIATVLLIALAGAAWSSGSTETAIVIAQDAMTHNGPLDAAPTGAVVHDGGEFDVLDTKNDWLQVRVDNQRVGWLKRDQVILSSGI